MQFVELDNRLDYWQAFVFANENGTFEQSVEQYHLLKKRGKQVRILGVIDEQNNIIAGSVVTWAAVKLGNLFTVDYGPLVKEWDAELLDCFLNGLKSFAKQHDGLFVKIGPRDPYQDFDDEGKPLGDPNTKLVALFASLGLEHDAFEYGMTDAGIARWQYVKDLTGLTEETIETTYKKTTRQYLKRIHQFGITLRILERADLPDFHTLTTEAAERRGFVDKDLSFYETAYDTYGDRVRFVVAELDFNKYLAEVNAKMAKVEPKLTKLLAKKESANETQLPKIERQINEFSSQVAAFKKQIQHGEELKDEAGQDKVWVAGGMFIFMPQEVDYLYSGMYQKYNEFFGTYLIQDYMLKEAIKQGIPLYNFLGIDGRFDGTDGVFEFKTRFGGYAQQMMGTFTMPVRPMRYRLYCILKKMIGRV